jgi:hypothetical protein
MRGLSTARRPELAASEPAVVVRNFRREDGVFALSIFQKAKS